MIDMFDRLGNTLNDIIGSAENNNVGYAIKQIYGYAEGGAVSGDSLGSGDLSLSNVLRQTASATSKSLNNSTGQHSAYNDPYFLTPHITSAYGRFFSGADTGSTNKPIQQPQQNKPLQSDDPNTFYGKFYEGIRRFAQTSELADRGQSQVRRT